MGIIEYNNELDNLKKPSEDFERYSEDELKDLTEETIMKIRERWKREGRIRNFKDYEANLRRELIEIYRGFNLVFGKKRPTFLT